MADNKYYVKNRSASMVVYSIPEDGIRREFAPSETKLIEKAELDKLTYQPGGRELMANFLQIQDAEVREELGIKAEPEYDYSEQDIATLITSGSLDAFLDCLDFAPTGIIDLIKELAVAIPMTDTRKIDALKEKTGFDLETALRHKAEEAAEDKAPVAETPTRRVAPATTGRRTAPITETKTGETTEVEAAPATPKYKVVSETKK